MFRYERRIYCQNNGENMNIIISGKSKIGISRSELEENVRKDGQTTGMTDEQLDKCKYIEKRLKDELGLRETLIDNHSIDGVK